MTPRELFTLQLGRANSKSPSVADYDMACAYTNILKADILALADWRFLYLVGTLTTVANDGTYDLASGVAYPIHWWDVTNNNPMEFKNPEDIIRENPAQDFTGSGLQVAVTGRDNTTGLWQVMIFPTPSTAGETLKYRYKGTVADFTVSDTTTTLLYLFPDWFRNALFWGGAALLKEDKEDPTAEKDWEKFRGSIDLGIQENRIVGPPPEIQVGGRGPQRLKINFDVTQ